jgi:integrative and conjugative element protein (TIGR02256 family)
MEHLMRGIKLSPSKCEEIVFIGAGVTLTILDTAHRKLLKYKQSLGRHEAGGMLFGSFAGSKVIVEDISTPSLMDKRSPNGYIWHKESANKTIKQFSRNGLHYLGDWHSHPQCNPIPSLSDTHSIRSTFNKSIHELNYFILFILSNEDIKKSYIALCDGKKENRLLSQM